MMYPVGKVEGDLAEVCDSADIQAQVGIVFSHLLVTLYLCIISVPG